MSFPSSGSKDQCDHSLGVFERNRSSNSNSLIVSQILDKSAANSTNVNNSSKSRNSNKHRVSKSSIIKDNVNKNKNDKQSTQKSANALDVNKNIKKRSLNDDSVTNSNEIGRNKPNAGEPSTALQKKRKYKRAAIIDADECISDENDDNNFNKVLSSDDGIINKSKESDSDLSLRLIIDERTEKDHSDESEDGTESHATDSENEGPSSISSKF